MKIIQAQRVFFFLTVSAKCLRIECISHWAMLRKRYCHFPQSDGTLLTTHLKSGIFQIDKMYLRNVKKWPLHPHSLGDVWSGGYHHFMESDGTVLWAFSFLIIIIVSTRKNPPNNYYQWVVKEKSMGVKKDKNWDTMVNGQGQRWLPEELTKALERLWMITSIKRRFSPRRGMHQLLKN